MKTRKPLMTIAIFALACAVPYFVSSLERFRFVNADRLRQAFIAPWSDDMLSRMFPPRIKPTPVPVVAANKPAAPVAPPPKFDDDYTGEEIGEPAPVPIENADALAPFYAALESTRSNRTDADPHSITRILHIGDSPLAADLISSEARDRLQKQFGDAGPGWHLAGRPWEFYLHDGITLKSKGWKNLSPLLQSPGNKGDYGLQGIAFSASSRDAYSTFTGWRKNRLRFSRLEVHYQAKPAGGSLQVLVDGDMKKEISTASAARELKMDAIEVDDTPHEVTLRPKGDGDVTLFGVAMEREQPGVIYDSLGSVGASIHWMTLPNLDEWSESLRLRRPHLVILGLGTNESGYGYLPTAQYEGDYRKIIESIRGALPQAAILIMAPMDRGTRSDQGEIITMPAIPKLVAAQQRVAQDNHCAFFNTYEAMGGEGTMARWYHGKPRLVGGDFTHPTANGAGRVGKWLVRALLAGANPAPAEASTPNSSRSQMQPSPPAPKETMILGELQRPRLARKPQKCCRSGLHSHKRVRVGS